MNVPPNQAKAWSPERLCWGALSQVSPVGGLEGDCGTLAPAHSLLLPGYKVSGFAPPHVPTMM